MNTLQYVLRWEGLNVPAFQNLRTKVVNLKEWDLNPNFLKL